MLQAVALLKVAAWGCAIGVAGALMEVGASD